MCGGIKNLLATATAHHTLGGLEVGLGNAKRGLAVGTLGIHIVCLHWSGMRRRDGPYGLWVQVMFRSWLGHG